VPGRLQAIAFGAVAFCGLILLCSRWYGPDIWYHLYLGQRIAETGSVQPADNLIASPPLFINIYWLFQLAIGALHRLGGIGATSVFFVAGWAAAFWFAAKTARLRAAGALGALVALAAILVCQPRFDPRPEVVSYALLALQIYWLRTWDFSAPLSWRKIALFAGSEAIWANVHGYFVFGPLLVGARIVAAFVAPKDSSAGRSSPAVRQLALLFAATLVATIVSPLGFRTWECVLLLTKTLRELRTEVQEFYPPITVYLRYPAARLFWVYWLATFLSGCAILFRAPRREFFALALSLAGLVLGASAARNCPLLVLLGAPAVGLALPWLPWSRRELRGLALAVAAAALALGAWAIQGGFYEAFISRSGFGFGEAEGAYPARFVHYLRGTKFDGKLFNASRDGGYLELHFPRLRLYGDSRFVDAAAVRAYFAAAAEPDAFRALQAAENFDGALLPVELSRDLIEELLRDPAWKIAHADLYRVFLVNTKSPAGAALPAPGIELYHGEDLTSLKNAPCASQWIALLALAQDRASLVRALRQFSAAPKIPSMVGEFALRYARELNDREIVALVRPLRPKFFAPSAQDQQQLEEAFAETAAM
jgi:hypothetical protein